MRSIKPSTRVKVIDATHPAYGRVGTVKEVAGLGVLVKLDHHERVTAVAESGLRRVKVISKLSEGTR